MEKIFEQISDLLKDKAIDEKIHIINTIKIFLHTQSPLKNEPVDCVIWVKNDEVVANDYNPNKVAPPEMELLKVSIMEDGYTQPIVTYSEDNKYVVVDGFHRNRVGKEIEEVRNKIYSYLPVTIVRESQLDRGDRIASTIRHNRARGKHQVSNMSDIVLELKRRNWSDNKIAKNLGMDADEILRLSQISGIADIFKDEEFSKSWDAENLNEVDILEEG